MRKQTIVITPRILATLYKGSLPIAWGHFEGEGGKTWLGISVATGYEKKGAGTKLIMGMCKYADQAGWVLWLSCQSDWIEEWYKKFGFKRVGKLNGKLRFMRRGSKLVNQ